MSALLSSINPMMMWFIIGAILIFLELIVPGVFLVWLGIAAVILGAILSFVTMGTTMQILLFAILSVITVLIGVKFYKGKDRDITSNALNQVRGAEYVGKIYTLTAEVKNGEGRLPLGDSVWGIQGEDLPAGSKIKITKVSGNTLNFEKVA